MDFSGCNLRGVNFSSSQFAFCVFGGADLDGVSALSCQFISPDFSRANIKCRLSRYDNHGDEYCECEKFPEKCFQLAFYHRLILSMLLLMGK